ncbi:MFS transporter [Mesorhizobium ventifaucium]|uniref:MFS domain-containing protein n=2 Tax=Mesorhizobium TaxID=68287 RepID=A0ABN8JA44_9HYPH|nr:MFS transporter [Mesorhizobium ventifaucium]CAH2394114.1 MFS domain-containing protein [Mesorhizobium ventifaucium]
MMPRPWFCLAALSGVLALVGIDMTVLNVTLPHLTEQLGASTSEKLWMVNAYSLLMAGFLPGFGALSDRIGHRKMLCGGLLATSFGLTCTNPLPKLRP